MSLENVILFVPSNLIALKVFISYSIELCNKREGGDGLFLLLVPFREKTKLEILTLFVFPPRREKTPAGTHLAHLFLLFSSYVCIHKKSRLHGHSSLFSRFPLVWPSSRAFNPSPVVVVVVAGGGADDYISSLFNRSAAVLVVSAAAITQVSAPVYIGVS